jgi:Ca-activated chloride channel family protein
VDLVTVGVRVTDSRGRHVPNLKADNFSIFDDGTKQKIEFFSAEEQPITLGIVFDHSASMLDNNKIDRAKEAALTLVRGARDGSEFFYVEFNEQVRLVADFTTDRTKVESAIQKTVAAGGTSLYDAVLESVSMTGRAKLARQALVIISDGADQHSRHRLEETMSLLRQSEMQVFTIGYFSRDEERAFRNADAKLTLTDGTEIDNPNIVLSRLAKESGGVSFFPRNDAELARAVDEITNDLRTQYTVSFYPTNPAENRYHQLRVTVGPGRYDVRARPGYGTLDVPAAAVRADSSRAFEAKVEKKNGRISYRDDFTDKNSGWPDRTTAKYARNGYLLTGNIAAAMNGPVFRNFRASVSVTVSTPAAPVSGSRPPLTLPQSTGSTISLTGGGLIFRQTDAGFYAVTTYPTRSGQSSFLAVLLVTPSKTTELNRWASFRSASTFQRIEVRCREAECEIFLDGNLRGKIIDRTFPQGRVGFYLSGRGDALFQNLVVEEEP